jgi:hypothetical protein
VRKLVLIASSGIDSEKKSFLFKVIGLSLLGQKGIDKINKIVYGNLEIPEEVVRFGRLVFNNFTPRMGGLHVFSDNELRNLTMPTFFIAGEKGFCSGNCRGFSYYTQEKKYGKSISLFLL